MATVINTGNMIKAIQSMMDSRIKFIIREEADKARVAVSERVAALAADISVDMRLDQGIDYSFNQVINIVIVDGGGKDVQ